MINRKVMSAAFVCAFAALAVHATPAHAQLGWTFVGVGDFDTSDVYLVLGGVSVSPTRAGWSPVAGVTAYWLQYPLGSDHQNVTSVTPSIGLKNSFGTGAFQARVGYSFSNKDDVPLVNAEASGSGVVNSAQVDYWGTGAMSAQAIGSYNWGSEAFWGRGRLGFRVARFGDVGSISVGPEATYLTSSGYNATRVGGVLGFNPGRGTTINAAVGRKFPSIGEDATYFTFELVLYPH
ncbi:MAG TPA: cellulose biosynthesis protein BcsS [Longimicrobiales bacterium]